VTGSRAVSWLAEVVESYLSAFSPIQFNGRHTVLVGPGVESFLDVVTTSNTSSDVLSVRSSTDHQSCSITRKKKGDIRMTILASLSSLQCESSERIVPGNLTSSVLGSEVVVESNELSLVGS
jgi:hypothetical protein